MILKPSRSSRWTGSTIFGLSLSRTETKTVPGGRHQAAGAELALGEGDGVVAVEAHRLAGRAHLRAEQRVDAGEAGEGEHRLLDRDMVEFGRLQAEARRAARRP